MDFPQQFSKLASTVLRSITPALFVVFFGAGAALAQTKAAKTIIAPDDQSTSVKF